MKKEFFLNALETKDLIKSKTYKFSQQENKKDIRVHNRSNELYS
jgi:hypothetical protein